MLGWNLGLCKTGEDRVLYEGRSPPHRDHLVSIAAIARLLQSLYVTAIECGV